MPSNATQNFQLSQWSKDDQVRMEDFNADNEKIDAAIKAVDARVDGLSAGKANVSALNALQTVVNGKGNCKIEFGSYVGDGDKYRVMSITTSLKPRLIIVGSRLVGVFFRGVETALSLGNSGRDLILTWSEHGVSWKLSISGDIGDLLNLPNTTYYYAAIE